MESIVADRYYAACKTLIQTHIDNPGIADEIRTHLIDLYASLTLQNAPYVYQEAVHWIDYAIGRENLLGTIGLWFCVTGSAYIVASCIGLVDMDEEKIKRAGLICFLGVGLGTLAVMIDQ